MHIRVLRPRLRSDQFYIQQIYKLRAQVFSGRLNWDVEVVDGCEIDEFDACDPSFIAVVSDEERVLGCARLLPFSGRTMVGSTFAGLKYDGSCLPERLVESSRFCVDTSAVTSLARGAISQVTLRLISAIISWSKAQGFKGIITVTEVKMERLLRLSGVLFVRLSDPVRIGSVDTVVGFVPLEDREFDFNPKRKADAEHAARQRGDPAPVMEIGRF